MRRILYVVMGMSIGLIIACATAPKRPAWVYKGGAAFPGDEGVYIYGVGVSAKSVNPAAMIERAEHRARLQIARGIKTYVAALLKDFMVDYPDYFNPDAAGSEEYLERVSKEVVIEERKPLSKEKRWQIVEILKRTPIKGEVKKKEAEKETEKEKTKEEAEKKESKEKKIKETSEETKAK